MTLRSISCPPSTRGALLLLAVLSACTLQRPPLDGVALEALGSRYTAAWSSGDAASVAGFFAEDGSLQINDGDPSVGREALTALAQGFMTALPDMVLTMDSIRRVGSGAEYFWTLEGTNTGPGGTGNRVRISGHEEWTLAPDGLVQRSLGHMDSAEYQRQLEEGGGVVPPFTISGPVFLAIQLRDLAGTGEWYRATFGLHEANRLTAEDGRSDVLILTGGNLTVELLRLRESLEPPPMAFGLFKVGFEVDDIEAAHNWIAARGARVDAQPFTDEALGMRSVVFRDPEGNRLQAFQRCGEACP